MSYTLSQPSLTDKRYQPSENLTWFTIDSSNKNEDSFSYKIEVYVADVDGTFGATADGSYSVPPRPVSGEANFSPLQVVKNYVTSELSFPAGVNDDTSQTSTKKYNLKFYETYIGATGEEVENFLVASSQFRIWDAWIPDTEFINFDYRDYIVTTASTENDYLYLTDGPTERKVLENDNIYAIPFTGIYPNTNEVSTALGPSGADWTVQFNFNNWYQEASTVIHTGALAWTSAFGGSITKQNIPLGEYSSTAWQDANSFPPYPGTGPLFEDDVFVWTINTPHPFSAAVDYNDLTLWWHYADNPGQPFTANVSVYRFDKIDTNGSLSYRWSGTIPQDLDYVGFCVYNNGERFSPYLLGTTDYSVTSSGNTSVYWYRKDLLTDTTIRTEVTEFDKVSWVNVGTDGMAQGLTGSYEVWLGDGAGTKLSESITYTPGSDCSNCEKVSLAWLNSKGGYDTYQFNCLVEDIDSANRTNGENTLPSDYTIGQRGRINVRNTAKTNRKVSTDWITQTDAEWLESLFMSPDVFEVSADRSILPVILNNTSYSQFVKQDKLKRIEFDYSVAYIKKSQIN